MDQPVHSLAYGKRRLLEIALALACRPRVLLLDEPVAGVPEGERQEIFETIDALPAEVSILLIEHDMDLVFNFAKTVTVLVNGAVFTEGDVATVSQDPRVKAVYLGEDACAWLSCCASRGLSAGYGEAVVVQGVDFALEAGRSLALLGRNGTGKTTLLNTLIGVTRRHGGTIALAGRDVTALAPHQRAAAGIGWVPQERNIFKSLSVDENLTAVARPGPWTPQRVYEMFPRLEERKANLGNQLSGGEQQMLAVARALVLNPKLLLLDEPLEGLAPIIVQELLRSIERLVLHEGLSAIIVEQNPRQILPITHDAIVLDRGQVVHARRASSSSPIASSSTAGSVAPPEGGRQLGGHRSWRSAARSRADVRPALLLLLHHLDDARRHVADLGLHVGRRELHAVHRVLAGVDLDAALHRVGDAVLDGRVGLQHVDARAVGDQLDLDAFAADAFLQVDHVVEDHVPARRIVVGHLEQGAVAHRLRLRARRDGQHGGEEGSAAGEEEGSLGHRGHGGSWQGRRARRYAQSGRPT